MFEKPPDDGKVDLRELHRLYILYTEELGKERGRIYPIRELESFTAWWGELSPRSRQVCEKNYRAGYANVIATQRAQIQSMLAAEAV
jgi:hypothetical protein